jgi:hypothetical protein
MTVEELLIPRYKVIADFPGNEWEVGVVFEKLDKTAGWLSPCFNINIGMRIETAEKYPHLFRKLEWWEERDFDLTGMYIRVGDKDKPHEYYKLVEKVEYRGFELWGMIDPTGHKHYYPLNETFPATEKEYNDYIKQKQTP